MTPAAWVLLALAAASAVTDWLGVVHGQRSLRWIGKPATILLLMGVALALRPVSETQRNLFVAALLLSLFGDVYLLLTGEKWFRTGLAAFLAAHLAYSAGFLEAGVKLGLLAISVPAVAVVSIVAGRQVIGSARGSGGSVVVPVAVYLAAISTMVAVASASGRLLALAGALLFYFSDGLIAWSRFVRPLPWAPLPIIVTYHVAQATLVVSLAMR